MIFTFSSKKLIKITKTKTKFVRSSLFSQNADFMEATLYCSVPLYSVLSLSAYFFSVHTSATEINLKEKKKSKFKIYP